MHTLPIPADEQIRAILAGTVYDLLSRYVSDPRTVDIRRFLTVQRPQLIEHLGAYPDLAEAYFRKHSATQTTHDVPAIWEENGMYATAWMDHGTRRWSKRFGTLAEAVAEHAALAHGL